MVFVPLGYTAPDGLQFGLDEVMVSCMQTSVVLCMECDNHLWSAHSHAAVVHQRLLQASTCHTTCCNQSNAICT